MTPRRAITFASLAVALLTGCVERRFRVESDPPGAYVSINNVPYGPTPVDVPFVYYGKYDIKLEKEGFATLMVMEPIDAPWWQYPVTDFFAESVYPGQLTDIRPLLYKMEPATQPNVNTLKAAGEELRSRGKELPEPRYPPKKDEPATKKGSLPAPKPVETLPVPKTLDLPS